MCCILRSQRIYAICHDRPRADNGASGYSPVGAPEKIRARKITLFSPRRRRCDRAQRARGRTSNGAGRRKCKNEPNCASAVSKSSNTKNPSHGAERIAGFHRTAMHPAPCVPTHRRRLARPASPRPRDNEGSTSPDRYCRDDLPSSFRRRGQSFAPDRDGKRFRSGARSAWQGAGRTACGLDRIQGACLPFSRVVI